MNVNVMPFFTDIGPVHKRTNHVPKDVSERDRPFPDLKAWFYPLWTQSCFKSGFWNAKKGRFGVLERDPPRKPDSRTCERKALSERDSCVHMLEMRAEAMHGL